MRSATALKRFKIGLLITFFVAFVCFTRPAASRWDDGAETNGFGAEEKTSRDLLAEAAKAHREAAIKIESAPEAATLTAPGPNPGPEGWSFRNHVIPVLTKMGCNSGACHGALAGKNGFKLTLRGYDPELDYAVLTRQAAARRVSLVEPHKSLILLKPTLTIPHGGGKRFDPDSLEYRVISEWIAAGAPPPTDRDPQIQKLEVTPSAQMLKIGDQTQVKVRAIFSDGHTEDVTRWAKYTSSDAGIAAVDENGRIKMLGHGESTISVWYLSRVASARVGVPFPSEISQEAFAKAARRNFIDELVLKKLRELNIAPSGPATDNQFIRRAYLDAIGVLPAPDEVRRFTADASPDKRDRLIDMRLERPEYVDYWSYKWADLLLVSSRKLPPKTLLSFNRWIRESVERNKPWDQFVRELITSSGNSQENGAVSYYVVHRTPIDRAENMTVAFMGIRMTCARCHNHPMEKWTQKDYYSLANLFARVSLKNGAGPGDVEVFTSPAGEINHPRLGRPLAPRPLDGEAIPLDSPRDRRVHFADWLTSPANPYFARMIVNRVWRNFMGRGLVEPVDDMRATNPASNEELLRALEEDFIQHKFDLKHLIRTIMQSGTYQTSAAANDTNAGDERYYSHYIVKRLPAEVILDALSQVTGVPTKFEGQPPGTRAMQLPDSRIESYFLTIFGRPERLITAESERMPDPTLTQALHIINGDTLNEKLRAPGNVIDAFIKENLPDDRIIERLYLAAFSREPSAQEKERLAEAIAREKGDDRRQVLEDLAWAVLTSKEFLFNH